MEFIAKFAEQWLPLYGLHAIEASLFVLAVFALAALTKHDIPARYSLLVIGLIKFFIPPFYSAPVHLPAVATAPQMLQAITVGGGQQSGQLISVSMAVFALWFISALVLLGFILWQNLRLRARLCNAVSMQFHAQNELFHLVPVELDVLVSASVRTPLLLGIFRPKLYLPESCQKLSQRELKGIIAHEMSHYSSMDRWILPLQTLALVLFWWNPLIWALHHKLLYFRELRCDLRAIEHAGIAPVEYSKLLYNFLEQQKIAEQFMPAGAYFAHNRKNIFNRLQHILEIDQKSKTTPGLLKGIVCALAVIIFIPLSVGWQVASFQTGLLPKSQSSSAITFITEDSLSERGENLASSGEVGAPGPESPAQPAAPAIGLAPKPADAISPRKGKPPSARISEKKSEKSIFVKYDHAPKPIGGFAAIQKWVVYPEIARKAGIEGRVIVNVLIDANGSVADVKILKSLGHNGCDQAAINAVKSVKWQPALYQGEPVSVWVGIPVIFNLSRN